MSSENNTRLKPEYKHDFNLTHNEIGGVSNVAKIPLKEVIDNGYKILYSIAENIERLEALVDSISLLTPDGDIKSARENKPEANGILEHFNNQLIRKKDLNLRLSVLNDRLSKYLG